MILKEFDFILGVVQKWRHAILTPTPSSRSSLLRPYYRCHKIFYPSLLRPWRHPRMTTLLELEERFEDIWWLFRWCSLQRHGRSWSSGTCASCSDSTCCKSVHFKYINYFCLELTNTTPSRPSLHLPFPPLHIIFVFLHLFLFCMGIL